MSGRPSTEAISIGSRKPPIGADRGDLPSVPFRPYPNPVCRLPAGLCGAEEVPPPTSSDKTAGFKEPLKFEAVFDGTLALLLRRRLLDGMLG